jgi:hypothetical protein
MIPFALRWMLSALALFAAMLELMELGARRGRRLLASDAEGARSGLSAPEGVVFALLGLLIAFSFAGALERFGQRRALIVEEANAIGTAWLRLDLLAPDARAVLQRDLRNYLDARLLVYATPDDQAAVLAASTRVGELQAELWERASAAARAEGQAATMLLLPALNECFDIAATRMTATQNHPPAIVFWLLIATALTSALLAGLAMAPSKGRHWLHRLVFAGVVALTVYTIQDLEYPRLGLVRVDALDQVLVELRESMESPPAQDR